MPEQGRYEKVPRPESIEAFISYLNGSKAVSSVVQSEHQILAVTRNNLTSLKVFMTNIYIVGIAEVNEIISCNRNINAIVTMSAWNSYTNEAKSFCKERGIGLFQFKEFLGSLYFDGEKYLNYIPPDERERIRRQTRRD